MKTFTVLKPKYIRLQEKNEEGENLWLVRMQKVGQVQALDSISAVSAAKAAGFRIPIIQEER